MQAELTPVTKHGILARLRQAGLRAPLSSAFVKFLIVGGISYLINQFALFLLYDALPVLPAQHTHVNLIVFTEPDISLLIASIVAVELSIIFKFYALRNGRSRTASAGATTSSAL